MEFVQEIYPWERRRLSESGIDGVARYVAYRHMGLEPNEAMLAALSWVRNEVAERRRRRSHGVA